LKKKVIRELDQETFISFDPDQLDDFTFKQLEAVDPANLEALYNDRQSAIAGILERLL